MLYLYWSLIAWLLLTVPGLPVLARRKLCPNLSRMGCL
jgi:hypothetical protein